MYLVKVAITMLTYFPLTRKLWDNHMTIDSVQTSVSLHSYNRLNKEEHFRLYLNLHKNNLKEVSENSEITIAIC